MAQRSNSHSEMDVQQSILDYAVIGSGFGGSVSAMRLAQKGYSVLVLERGKRYEDKDFPTTNWNLPKFLWFPSLRCFGAFQMSLFNGLFVFHSSGVGGGSLVYAAVLMEPDESFFEASTWRHLGDWKTVLRPHYATARRMLGVAPNPHSWPSDRALQLIAEELGRGDTYRPTEVGVYFGEASQDVADPYFGGAGPARSGCNDCGDCMVGCRHNAKNTLTKNYLYLAEQWGARVRGESEVDDIRPLPQGQMDGARFEVVYRRSTAWLAPRPQVVRAKNVVVAAGTLGTLSLLLHCRDGSRSLPGLSMHVGETVRTNSEAFLGSFTLKDIEDHSKGLAITSIIGADDSTQIEPVRFGEKSSLIFWLLAAPLIEPSSRFLVRLWRMVRDIARHPRHFLAGKRFSGMTRRGTAIMVMQTQDNMMRLRIGRSPFTLFRRGLVPEHGKERAVPVNIDLGHQIIRSYADKIGGIPLGTLTEGLLNVPTTAHPLGGCLFGRDVSEGVIDLDCQAFGYPGLYIVDGTIVPANPGVNPSLTITAMAEYAMSRIPAKDPELRRRRELAIGEVAAALR